MKTRHKVIVAIVLFFLILVGIYFTKFNDGNFLDLEKAWENRLNERSIILQKNDMVIFKDSPLYLDFFGEKEIKNKNIYVSSKSGKIILKINNLSSKKEEKIDLKEGESINIYDKRLKSFLKDENDIITLTIYSKDDKGVIDYKLNK